MDDQSFFCETLVFINPDEIAPGIAKFLKEYGVGEIISVTHFVTAVQQAPNIMQAGSAPQIQYQFRFVIIYI